MRDNELHSPLTWHRPRDRGCPDLIVRVPVQVIPYATCMFVWLE